MTANHAHTPTTEEVKTAYRYDRTGKAIRLDDCSDPSIINVDHSFDRWMDARDARIIAAAKAEAYREAQQIIAGDMTIEEQRGRRGADKIDAAYLIRELDQEIQELQEDDDE